MPAATPLSIFKLIPLRPAPVSLSRARSAGHLSCSSICSIYLAAFFLLLAPHRRRCLPNKLACRFLDFSSLPYLSVGKRAAAAPSSVLTWCSKYSWQLEFRPDRWHAKSERTKIFCLLLPCEAKDLFTSFGESFLAVAPCNTTVLLKAIFSPWGHWIALFEAWWWNCT